MANTFSQAQLTFFHSFGPAGYSGIFGHPLEVDGWGEFPENVDPNLLVVFGLSKGHSLEQIINMEPQKRTDLLNEASAFFSHAPWENSNMPPEIADRYVKMFSRAQSQLLKEKIPELRDDMPEDQKKLNFMKLGMMQEFAYNLSEYMLSIVARYPETMDKYYLNKNDYLLKNLQTGPVLGGMVYTAMSESKDMAQAGEGIKNRQEEYKKYVNPGIATPQNIYVSLIANGIFHEKKQDFIGKEIGTAYQSLNATDMQNLSQFNGMFLNGILSEFGGDVPKASDKLLQDRMDGTIDRNELVPFFIGGQR